MSRRLLRVYDFGRSLVPYETALALQEALVLRRKTGAVVDTLVLLQHPHVFTLGKRGSRADFKSDPLVLRRLGAAIVTIPRGGQTTYHGPGQVVAYPIVNLREAGIGARVFVEGLEDCMIRTLGAYGISARGRLPGATGVWVGERKIGAIGVRISHAISSHGLALNVATDLSMYDHIVPCGINDKPMTSLAQEMERSGGGGSSSIGSGGGSSGLDAVDVARQLAAAFAKTFNYSSVEVVRN